MNGDAEMKSPGEAKRFHGGFILFHLRQQTKGEPAQISGNSIYQGGRPCFWTSEILYGGIVSN